MALSLMIAGVRVALVLQGKKAANDFNATGEDIGGRSSVLHIGQVLTVFVAFFVNWFYVVVQSNTKSKETSQNPCY